MKDYFEYRILQLYGGIFLDYDIVCLKPFDELAHRYEFFAHLEPYNSWNKQPSANVGIMGSIPQHPIINRINEDYEKYFLDKGFRGYMRVKITRRNTQDQNLFKAQMIVANSVLEICRDKIEECKDIVVFPATYFESPYLSYRKETFWLRKLYRNLDLIITLMM